MKVGRTSGVVNRGATRHAVWSAAAIALLATACDRTPSHRQTRAGTAIALETRHTAASLAERLAARPDPACGTYQLVGPARAEVHWVVEGARDGGLVLELEETRTVEIDGASNLRVLRHAEFLAERGRTGQREREWRLVDGQVYTRDLNLPFEHRQADVSDAARLLDQAAEVFETLVWAAGDVWTDVAADGSGFELTGGGAGHVVRCGREGEPDPWLAPLLSEAEVVEAHAHVERRSNGLTRTGAFTFQPIEGAGRDLRVVVEETIDFGAAVEPIGVPEAIAATEPRRRSARIERFLRDLEAVGGVRAEPVDMAGSADGSGERE